MAKSQMKKVLFKKPYEVSAVVDNESYKGQNSIVDDSTYETIQQKLKRMQRGDYKGLAGSNGGYEYEEKFDDKGKLINPVDVEYLRNITDDPDFSLAQMGALNLSINERHSLNEANRILSEKKAKYEALKKEKAEAEEREKVRKAKIDKLLEGK